jgi:hypothetical protein
MNRNIEPTFLIRGERSPGPKLQQVDILLPARSWRLTELRRHICIYLATKKLEKILPPRASTWRYRPPVFWNGAENRELGGQVLAQGHDRRNIATPVTVVRCRPDSYNVVILKVVLLNVSTEKS